MVDVIPAHRIMQYGQRFPFRPAASSDHLGAPTAAPAPATTGRYELARQSLGKRVREHLVTAHALAVNGSRVGPTNDGDLELIQRRLAQQLEEKQQRLKDSIVHQQNELVALRTQLESQPNLHDNPVMKVHLTILRKLEMKRAKQEKMLHDLKSAYENQTKPGPLHGDGTGRLPHYAHCNSPPASTISSPPSESSDTDSSSTSQQVLSPSFQMCSPQFEGSSLNMQVGRQRNGTNVPMPEPIQQGSNHMSDNMALTNGVTQMKPHEHVKHEWNRPDSFYKDLPPVAADNRFPVPGLWPPGHSSRDQGVMQRNANSFMMPSHQLPVFNQSHMTHPLPHPQPTPADRQYPMSTPAHLPFQEGGAFHQAQPAEDMNFHTLPPVGQQTQGQHEGHQPSMRPLGRGPLMYREYPHSGSQGDGLDQMTATLPGLESGPTAPGFLVDSLLGMDTEEFGQYMGPASPWLMAQKQWQNTNGSAQGQCPPSQPISGQGGQIQEGRQVVSSQNDSYGWL